MLIGCFQSCVRNNRLGGSGHIVICKDGGVGNVPAPTLRVVCIIPICGNYVRWIKGVRVGIEPVHSNMLKRIVGHGPICGTLIQINAMTVAVRAEIASDDPLRLRPDIVNTTSIITHHHHMMDIIVTDDVSCIDRGKSIFRTPTPTKRDPGVRDITHLIMGNEGISHIPQEKANPSLVFGWSIVQVVIGNLGVAINLIGTFGIRSAHVTELKTIPRDVDEGIAGNDIVLTASISYSSQQFPDG